MLVTKSQQPNDRKSEPIATKLFLNFLFDFCRDFFLGFCKGAGGDLFELPADAEMAASRLLEGATSALSLLHPLLFLLRSVGSPHLHEPSTPVDRQLYALGWSSARRCGSTAAAVEERRL